MDDFIPVNEPYRLVFVRYRCDFCGTKENVSPYFREDYLYGFMCCKDEDCFMTARDIMLEDNDKRGVVFYKDILEKKDCESCIKLLSFLELLKDGGYPVSRTGGKVEYDWKFNPKDSIARKDTGDWVIPSIKEGLTPEDNLFKKSSIEFMIRDFTNKLNSSNEDEKNKILNFIDKAEKALEVLRGKFYQKVYILGDMTF